MNADSTLEDGIVAAKANKGMIARLQFEQVTELEPNRASGWVWLAWTCDSPELALEHLAKAQQLAPDNEVVAKFLDVVRALDTFDAETTFKSASTSEEDNSATSTKPTPEAAAPTDDSSSKSTPAAKSEKAKATTPEVAEKAGSKPEAETKQAEPKKQESSKPAKENSEPAAAKVAEPQVTSPPETDSTESKKSVEQAAGPKASDNADTKATPADSELSADTLAERERAAAAFAFIANKAATVASSDDNQPSPEPPKKESQPSAATTTEGSDAGEEVPLEEQLNKLTENIEQMQEEIRAETAQKREPVQGIVEEPAGGSQNNSQHDNTNAGTILVVDDSATVRKIVSMTLESAGYNVISAEDGIEATKILVKSSPNLILLDIKMPRMSGYKLCKLIKAHPDTSGIPVIMLSGKDGVFDKLRGKMVGCNDYISKPFESADLLASVSEHINMAIPH